MFKEISLILSIIALALASCPANPKIDGLLAGKPPFYLRFHRLQCQPQRFFHLSELYLRLPAKPGSRAQHRSQYLPSHSALQDFSVNYLAANNFAIYPAAVSSSQATFTFDFSAPLWSKVKVNFWASTNQQIQVGFFKVDNLQTLPSCNCAVAYTSINSAFAQSDNPVLRVFLNGFDVSSSTVQLSVTPTNLQGTKLTIKVSVGTSTTLKRIWLSWVAFSPVSSGFGSYGGQVSQAKYSGSVSSDISNSLYQNTYSLFGLNLISLTASQPLAFSSNIDADFVLTIASNNVIDNFALIYVAVGVLPSKLCSSCGNGLVVSGSKCVMACPEGTYSGSYKDGGVACRTCSSKLGLILNGGKCVAATTTTYTVTTTTTISANLPAASTAASSASSSSSASSNVVTFSPSCPTNAQLVNGECACNIGYVYLAGKCQLAVPVAATPINTPVVPPTPADPIVTPTPTPTPIPRVPSSGSCGANSYDNGLGICVCSTGFYFNNGACSAGAACGVNSRRNSDGSCSCESGFTNYGGTCSKCPQGALWSSSTNQCIFVCGQNAAYSASSASCQCNPGFGLYAGSCQTCPNNYFVSSGYCVTCPVNSQYNSDTQNCDCQSGFYTNQVGACTKKCGTNEVYNTNTQSCNCVLGLGRINGACQLCPAGSTPSSDGSSCSACKENQILVNGQCVCQQGFAFNSAQVCSACSTLPNGFLINRICAVCPGNMIYNGNSCACPQGKIAQGSLCISQCQNDELLDSDGNCFTCGLNQVISNGQCICSTGYTLSSCGVCVLSCQSDQFSFQGSCAACPLNTIFNSAINGCSCPSGFYMNTYGVCEKLTLQPIACPSGQYFDSSSGCQACSSSCATCKSATQCLTCKAAGFSANAQGVCNPTCGDGIIVSSEGCDTGSSYSAGCLSCQIQSGYTCSGQPSVCRSTAPAPTPTPVPTPTPTPAPTPASAALAQLGTTNINSNNVFITLKTSQTFTFANPTEMQSFIQATFPSGPKPTMYCAQRSSPNLNLFDCLLIYPSGVPNSQFTVNFSFNFQGKSGATSVKVNPLAINAAKANAGRGTI